MRDGLRITSHLLLRFLASLLPCCLFWGCNEIGRALCMVRGDACLIKKPIREVNNDCCYFANELNVDCACNSGLGS